MMAKSLSAQARARTMFTQDEFSRAKHMVQIIIEKTLAFRNSTDNRNQGRRRMITLHSITDNEWTQLKKVVRDKGRTSQGQMTMEQFIEALLRRIIYQNVNSL